MATTTTISAEVELLRTTVRHAIADPAAFTPRGLDREGDPEPITRWSARAVLPVVTAAALAGVEALHVDEDGLCVECSDAEREVFVLHPCRTVRVCTEARTVAVLAAVQ